MKFFLPALLCSLSFGFQLRAQDESARDKLDQKAEQHGKKPEEKAPSEGKDDKSKEEKPKEKTGKVNLGGVDVSYIAQTGTLPVFKEDGSVRANVFYVYYAATDAAGKRLASKDAAARPITYCFNGGPGASAVWLHLGGLGPRRVDLPPEGLTPATAAHVVDNANSILDATDLVFVDPVSTGLSRAAKGEKAEQFFNVEEDIQSVGEFVRLFTTREQRWASPKYLCGESYGVTRVAGLAEYLEDKHGLFPDGLILMSGPLSFQTLSASSGNDLPYISYLPAFTATAFYHQKLAPELQENLEKSVDESRAFACGDYALALLKGSALTADERKKVAAQIARLTGLNAAEIEEQNLRIDAGYFRKKLLWNEGKIIGRFDARVTAANDDRSSFRADFDPAFYNIVGAFSSAVNGYVRGELGYESDFPYRVLAELPWKWSGFENRFVSTAEKLGDAMQVNPKMRVLVLAGYRDLAVPEDCIRYSFDHLVLPDAVRANISYRHFESGHMMYLYRPDAEKLREDLSAFVKK